MNRWLYILAVVGACTASGLAMESGPHFLVRLGTGLGPVLLTYPAGVFGILVAMPLIYYGVATPSEAYLLASPLLALGGYLQWYVSIPWALHRRSRVGA